MSPPRSNRGQLSPTTVVIATTLFVFSVVSVISRIQHTNPSQDWDIIIFTQNWPISVCLKWEQETKNATCRIPQNKTQWTIHGMWPTKLGTIGPAFCDKEAHFSPESIYGLIPVLDEKWTPVEKHKSHFALWKHEWEKHGTCAKVLTSLGTEYLYFGRGLEWSQEFDIYRMLAKSNIVPRNTSYSPDQIWDAIKAATGKKPFINCYVKDGVALLDEIRICFTKELTLTDCDGIKMRRNIASLIDCPAKQLFYLDRIPPRPAPAVPLKENPWITSWKIIRLLQWATL